MQLKVLRNAQDSQADGVEGDCSAKLAQIAQIFVKLFFLNIQFVLNGTVSVSYFLCYFQHYGSPKPLKEALASLHDPCPVFGDI